MSRRFYLPPPLVEALGWATIARYEFELSVDVFTAVLTSKCDYPVISLPLDPFEDKLNYLLKVPRSRFLKHGWWRELRNIALKSVNLNKEYESAAIASVYGRGAGYLEVKLRDFSNKLQITPAIYNMTPSKINTVAERFWSLTDEVLDLAASLADASEKLSNRAGRSDERL